VLISGTVVLGFPGIGLTQSGDWQPTKPMRIIVSQAPGGSTDTTARAYADFLSAKLGVPVTVENRSGAAGMVAGAAVAHSTADGHTLLMTPQSLMALGPVLLKAPPIDPDKDLVPVASMGVGPLVAVLPKDHPASTIHEVVMRSKKKPVNVGNFAVGSGWQLTLNQLAKDTGGDFSVVNYKGTLSMLPDLYAGTIDMGAGTLAGMGGGLQKGLIRPILIVAGQRSRLLPGIPTWTDVGFRGPAYEDLIETNMLLAPTGTPQAVIDTLARLATASVNESQPMKAVRNTLSADDVPLVGAELKQAVMRSWTAYRNLARTMKLGME
jgi:tripartite-type tricarboxylate transporter receptor subunit TctC